MYILSYCISKYYKDEFPKFGDEGQIVQLKDQFLYNLLTFNNILITLQLQKQSLCFPVRMEPVTTPQAHSG